MTALFEKLLAISLTASWIVLAVMLLRLVLKPAPKWVNCLLWAIVALRLVLPVVPQSELSLVPRTQSVLQTA